MSTSTRIDSSIRPLLIQQAFSCLPGSACYPKNTFVGGTLSTFKIYGSSLHQQVITLSRDKLLDWYVIFEFIAGSLLTPPSTAGWLHVQALLLQNLGVLPSTACTTTLSSSGLGTGVLHKHHWWDHFWTGILLISFSIPLPSIPLSLGTQKPSSSTLFPCRFRFSVGPLLFLQVFSSVCYHENTFVEFPCPLVDNFLPSEVSARFFSMVLWCCFPTEKCIFGCIFFSFGLLSPPQGLVSRI